MRGKSAESVGLIRESEKREGGKGKTKREEDGEEEEVRKSDETKRRTFNPELSIAPNISSSVKTSSTTSLHAFTASSSLSCVLSISSSSSPSPKILHKLPVSLNKALVISSTATVARGWKTIAEAMRPGRSRLREETRAEARSKASRREGVEETDEMSERAGEDARGAEGRLAAEREVAEEGEEPARREGAGSSSPEEGGEEALHLDSSSPSESPSSSLSRLTSDSATTSCASQPQKLSFIRRPGSTVERATLPCR